MFALFVAPTGPVAMACGSDDGAFDKAPETPDVTSETPDKPAQTPNMTPENSHAFYGAMQEAVIREWGPEGRNISAASHFVQPDPVGKEEVIAQWHEAMPRMAEMTYNHAGAGHFSEEVKGPEMAKSVLEMNWPDQN